MLNPALFDDVAPTFCCLFKQTFRIKAMLGQQCQTILDETFKPIKAIQRCWHHPKMCSNGSNMLHLTLFDDAVPPFCGLFKEILGIKEMLVQQCQTILDKKFEPIKSILHCQHDPKRGSNESNMLHPTFLDEVSPTSWICLVGHLYLKHEEGLDIQCIQ